MACEINTYEDVSFVAATPPLGAKRLLLSEWAARRTQGQAAPTTVRRRKEGVVEWRPNQKLPFATTEGDGTGSRGGGPVVAVML